MSKEQHIDLFGECLDKATADRIKKRERYRTDDEYREKIKARNRDRYRTDPDFVEKKRQYAKLYIAANREQLRKKANERQKHRYHSDPEYRAAYLAKRRGRSKFKSDADRERHNAKIRAKYKNDAETKERIRASDERWHNKNRLRAIALRTIARARIRSLSVDKEFIFELAESKPKRCECCHKVIDYSYLLGKKKGARDNCPSFDRLIPSAGYVRGNVVIICWRCNVLKRDGSLEEFRKIVAYMRRCIGRLDS